MPIVFQDGTCGNADAADAAFADAALFSLLICLLLRRHMPPPLSHFSISH